MHFLRLYLWIAPHVLLAVSFVGLLRRGVRTRHPIFTAYIGFLIALFLTLITIGFLALHSLCSITSYGWVLVVGTGISTLLELGVLYELANELLLSRSFLSGIFRPLLRWTAAILLLVAAIVSASFSQPGMERVMSAFQTLDFSSSLIKVGLLLVLVLFTSVLDISWRSLSAGIALGFGISATAEMAASALLSALGKSGYITIDAIRMSAFHVCVLVWLIYIFLPEKPRTLTGESLSASEMEFWDQELQRLVRR